MLCSRCSTHQMEYLCVGCDVPLCQSCYVAHECPTPVRWDDGEDESLQKQQFHCDLDELLYTSIPARETWLCDSRGEHDKEPRWRGVLFNCSRCKQRSSFAREMTLAEAQAAARSPQTCVDCE